MKIYLVRLPFAGIASLEVEANSEQEAKDKAFNEVSVDDIDEWECFEKICSGNVLHAPLNEIEIEELSDEGEED